MYYPEEVIEEVRTRNDIVDIVSQYVNLKKKGANYFGLCPFHNEKSPSFSVSPGKQMYYCFGCGAGGNVITFVMEYENYTFVEAVKMLADRAGIALPEVEYSKEARAQADLKNTLLEINRLAANFFYYQLKQPSGKVGTQGCDGSSDPYRSVPGGTGESGSGYQQGGAAYPRRACDEGEVRA